MTRHSRNSSPLEESVAQGMVTVARPTEFVEPCIPSAVGQDCGPPSGAIARPRRHAGPRASLVRRHRHRGGTGAPKLHEDIDMSTRKPAVNASKTVVADDPDDAKAGWKISAARGQITGTTFSSIGAKRAHSISPFSERHGSGPFRSSCGHKPLGPRRMEKFRSWS
jgi:hypothetical protein